MQDNERDQAQNDLDVEIIDLPASAAGPARPAAKAGSRAFLARWPLGTRLSRRQRAFQGAITVSAVVLVFLVILVSAGPIRDAVGLRLFGPTPVPTPTLVPGSDLFYISGTPSWGNASIDGHILAHLPALGANPPLRLSRGQHTFTWLARPLLPIRCIVSVPPLLGTEQCDNGSAILGTFFLERSEIEASVITFVPSLTTLPDDQRASLINAIQAAIDASWQSTETVQPGELYVHLQPTGAVERAIQPLRATLHFQLDTSDDANRDCIGVGSGCEIQGQNCRQFCTRLDWQYTTVSLHLSSAAPLDSWSVVAVMRPLWNYTTTDNRAVAQNQPPASDDAMNIEHFITLYITWSKAGWHVIVSSTNPDAPGTDNFSCLAAQDIVSVDRLMFTGQTSVSRPIEWRFIPSAKSATGCLVVATVQNATASGAPSTTQFAYCLYRFGVPLAANDLAHHLWPKLAVANAYEQNLARKLAAGNS